MIKLITSNKVTKDIPGCEMHPEISVGMNRMAKWIKKKAQEKEETVIFTFNPIIFRMALLIKLQGEKVQFFYKGAKLEEVIVDDLGYFVNPPSHFFDLYDKIQDEIRNIRRERKYEQ